MLEHCRPAWRLNDGLLRLARVNRLELETQGGKLGVDGNVVLQQAKVRHLKAGQVVIVVKPLVRLEKTISRTCRLPPDTSLMLKVAKLPQGMQYAGRPSVEVHHE